MTSTAILQGRVGTRSATRCRAPDRFVALVRLRGPPGSSGRTSQRTGRWRAGWACPAGSAARSAAKLTHRQLDDDHRDRQHECGQADHRPRDGCQDHHGGIRSDGEGTWNRLVVEVAVERDCPEGEQHARQHAEDRDEPETRLHMDEELGKLHWEQRTYPFAHLGNEDSDAVDSVPGPGRVSQTSAARPPRAEGTGAGFCGRSSEGSSRFRCITATPSVAGQIVRPVYVPLSTSRRDRLLVEDLVNPLDVDAFLILLGRGPALCRPEQRMIWRTRRASCPASGGSLTPSRPLRFVTSPEAPSSSFGYFSRSWASRSARLAPFHSLSLSIPVGRLADHMLERRRASRPRPENDVEGVGSAWTPFYYAYARVRARKG